ncbi:MULTISPECIES: DUF397 domain-containing protein [unclassified Nocardia]|uniref:DUF397 domain-containing protein n=1 Tax=unclassified Nocardia TaxID=2637762 RepID=UPI00278C39B4|nr:MULTISPECIES: DUF397 domain-containing protein [unclassified Nocardia]
MSDLTGARWFKSSRSQGGEACVEAAHLTGSRVGVRDSKLGADSPVLVFDGPVWDQFAYAVKAGHFDLT